MSPLSLISLQMSLATLAWEAQTVMVLRLMGLTGAMPAKPGEWNRMVGEKPAAFAESWMRAAEATVAGKPPPSDALSLLPEIVSGGGSAGLKTGGKRAS